MRRIKIPPYSERWRRAIQIEYRNQDGFCYACGTPIACEEVAEGLHTEHPAETSPETCQVMHAHCKVFCTSFFRDYAGIIPSPLMYAVCWYLAPEDSEDAEEAWELLVNAFGDWELDQMMLACVPAELL